MENNELPELPSSFDEDGSINEAFKNVSQINLDEAKVIIGNDPDHTHVYKKDPTDETADFFAEMCDCGVGRLVRK